MIQKLLRRNWIISLILILFISSALVVYAQSSLSSTPGPTLADPDTTTADFIEAINGIRAQVGLRPFQANTILRDAAVMHTNDMVNRNYNNSHEPSNVKPNPLSALICPQTGAEADTVGDRLTCAGGTVQGGVGEVLAGRADNNADGAVRQLLTSYVHCTILMDWNGSQLGAAAGQMTDASWVFAAVTKPGANSTAQENFCTCRSYTNENQDSLENCINKHRADFANAPTDMTPAEYIAEVMRIANINRTPQLVYNDRLAEIAQLNLTDNVAGSQAMMDSMDEGFVPSGSSITYGTPQELVDALSSEFNFRRNVAVGIGVDPGNARVYVIFSTSAPGIENTQTQDQTQNNNAQNQQPAGPIDTPEGYVAEVIRLVNLNRPNNPLVTNSRLNELAADVTANTETVLREGFTIEAATTPGLMPPSQLAQMMGPFFEDTSNIAVGIHPDFNSDEVGIFIVSAVPDGDTQQNATTDDDNTQQTGDAQQPDADGDDTQQADAPADDNSQQTDDTDTNNGQQPDDTNTVDNQQAADPVSDAPANDIIAEVLRLANANRTTPLVYNSRLAEFAAQLATQGQTAIQTARAEGFANAQGVMRPAQTAQDIYNTYQQLLNDNRVVGVGLHIDAANGTASIVISTAVPAAAPDAGDAQQPDTANDTDDGDTQQDNTVDADNAQQPDDTDTDDTQQAADPVSDAPANDIIAEVLRLANANRTTPLVYNSRLAEFAAQLATQGQTAIQTARAEGFANAQGVMRPAQTAQDIYNTYQQLLNDNRVVGVGLHIDAANGTASIVVSTAVPAAAPDAGDAQQPDTANDTDDGDTQQDNTVDADNAQQPDDTDTDDTQQAADPVSDAPTNDIIAELLELANANRTTPLIYSGRLAQLASQLAANGQPTIDIARDEGFEGVNGFIRPLGSVEDLFTVFRPVLTNEQVVTVGMSVDGVEGRLSVIFAINAPSVGVVVDDGDTDSNDSANADDSNTDADDESLSDFVTELMALANANRTTPIRYSGRLASIAPEMLVQGGPNPAIKAQEEGYTNATGFVRPLGTAQEVYTLFKALFDSPDVVIFGVFVDEEFNRVAILFAAGAPANVADDDNDTANADDTTDAPADNTPDTEGTDNTTDETTDDAPDAIADPAPPPVEDNQVADDDNDGLANDVDVCPNEFGPPANNGCPNPAPPPVEDNQVADDDNDGLANDVDACPNEFGPPANNGCPEQANAGGSTTVSVVVAGDMLDQPNGNYIINVFVGEQVTIIGQDGGWVQIIDSTGQTGWVPASVVGR